jgi:hypothetical protein
MSNYAYCLLDRAGQALRPPELTFADDDGEAVAFAMLRARDDAQCASFELWLGNRCVHVHIFRPIDGGPLD